MKRFNKMTEAYLSKANGGVNIPGAYLWGAGLSAVGVTVGFTTSYLSGTKVKSK